LLEKLEDHLDGADRGGHGRRRDHILSEFGVEPGRLFGGVLLAAQEGHGVVLAAEPGEAARLGVAGDAPGRDQSGDLRGLEAAHGGAHGDDAAAEGAVGAGGVRGLGAAKQLEHRIRYMCMNVEISVPCMQSPRVGRYVPSEYGYRWMYNYLINIY